MWETLWIRQLSPSLFFRAFIPHCLLVKWESCFAHCTVFSCVFVNAFFQLSSPSVETWVVDILLRVTRHRGGARWPRRVTNKRFNSAAYSLLFKEWVALWSKEACWVLQFYSYYLQFSRTSSTQCRWKTNDRKFHCFAVNCSTLSPMQWIIAILFAKTEANNWKTKFVCAGKSLQPCSKALNFIICRPAVVSQAHACDGSAAICLLTSNKALMGSEATLTGGLS